MSNTIWAVDGSFFAQRLSGIQRYSIELLAALDRIVPPGFVEIVTPATAPTAALLEKYSWDKSAERLLQILAK